MHTKQILIIAAALFSGVLLFTAGREPEHFRITPEDEGMISGEFISRIRAGVGDEKASRASDELDEYVVAMLTDGTAGMSYNDVRCFYLNYLKRLYNKALRDAARGLSPEARKELLRKEKEWERHGCAGPDAGVPDSGGGSLIDIDPQKHGIRLYLNRTRYLECTPARRAELDRFHKLRVRCVRGSLPIEFNELRRVTPLDVLGSDERSRGKTYVEDIATLPPQFCREAKSGGDLYQMGILIPTNDVCFERSTQGYERILVIWKNREHHAHYYLPHHARIKEVEVHGRQVSVRYLQTDDFTGEVKRKKDVGQTFTVDFTYRIYAPIHITNWLNYYMDGLGNIHEEGCCRKKFGNSAR